MVLLLSPFLSLSLLVLFPLPRIGKSWRRRLPRPGWEERGSLFRPMSRFALRRGRERICSSLFGSPKCIVSSAASQKMCPLQLPTATALCPRDACPNFVRVRASQEMYAQILCVCDPIGQARGLRRLKCIWSESGALRCARRGCRIGCLNRAKARSAISKPRHWTFFHGREERKSSAVSACTLSGC